MTKTLTLPSGKIAEIRKGRGYDLLQAQIKAKDSEEIPYALIAELASINGQQLVYEDILDMDLEDVIALQTEISGKLQSAKAKKEDKIKENAVSEEKIEGNAPVYLKIEYAFNTGKTRADRANFFYSLDGENWKSIGETFSLGFDTATTFMGTRSWLVNYATKEAGGYVDFDYYKVK